jgi:hypothetical protein
VAPTIHDRFPLNFPTATVRGKTLLLNCKEKIGTNILKRLFIRLKDF